jgi:hypothetical protein
METLKENPRQKIRVKAIQSLRALRQSAISAL